MNATLSVNNRTKDKTKTSNGTGIRIIRIAAFAFAIVSWKATASGLSEYVFGSGWQSVLISFAIQAILFVFNLKLPFYFDRIGEKTPNREKKKYHFGAKKGIEKEAYKTTTLQKVIIGFYLAVLCSSSFFSFVYICNYVVYGHQSGYVDDNVILASSYRKILNDTDDYIAENKKAMQILASEILSDLQDKYPEEDSPASKQGLEDAVNIAQNVCDIAKEEYETVKDDAQSFKEEMDSYADSRNGTAWHDRQDEWEEKYEAAKEKWRKAIIARETKKRAFETAKTGLVKAKNALKNYKDSQKTIIAEILSEMLKVNPNAGVLEKHISKLNITIAELGTDADIVDNYGQLVETTQTLTVVVKDYISLVRVASDGDTDEETRIKYMMEHVMDDIVIPDPESESFENDYSSWRNTWDSKLSDLENLIQKLPLPRFPEKKSEGSEDAIINVELLEEYDANEKINTLDELRRSKISDINVIEKAIFLLFGRYWFAACFSFGLAFFLDISSLLAGLFIYGIRKKK